MSWRMLAVGDVVGAAGLQTLERVLPRLRRTMALDFIVVNGENAASNGNGLAAKGARRILNLGVDVLTLGDHWFRKGDLMPMLNEHPALLRPLNYPPEASGRGAARFRSGPFEVGVAIVQGRVFMEPVDNPFHAVDRALEQLAGCDLLFVEVHAEATSEKAALAHHLDGRVAAVWGTHTHVQTADERILPGGTAFISDLGMTGPHDGIIGRQIEPVLSKMRSGMPSPFRIAQGDLQLDGLLVEIDEDLRRVTTIERVAVALEDES